MEEKIIRLLQESMTIAREFRKKNYDSQIQYLQKEFQTELDELRVTLDGSEQASVEIALSFVKRVGEMLGEEPSKRKRGLKQLDYNMAMVSYVLPILNEIKSVRSRELAENIVKEWNSQFKDTNIGCPTIADISSGFKSGLCYITTAVCKSLGRPDNCYELNLLRDYRDQYMMRNESGKHLVEEYYNIAPTIVKRIDKSGDAKNVYHKIWDNYLERCVQGIEKENLSECQKIYSDMVKELRSKYLFKQ